MKNNYFLLFFISLSAVVFSQSKEKIIHGKVISETNTTSGINVINLVSEKSVLTNSNGEFQILAKVGDMLILSSENFEYKRKLLEEEDFGAKIVIIEMTPKPGQLEEVVITKYQNFNAVDLGILEKPAKEYTPAERRLKTAGDFKPIHLLGILGGSLPLDPIINAINGRTKRLKKEISIETREFRLQEIDELYEDNFYIQTLKIPADYIMGFKYFLTEEEDFATLVLAKNKPSIEIYMVKTAESYLKLIADEKE